MFAKHAYLETGTGGSNPPLSANKQALHDVQGFFVRTSQVYLGELTYEKSPEPLQAAGLA